MKQYNEKAINGIVEYYKRNGGKVYSFNHYTSNNYILKCDGLKTAVIKENGINMLFENTATVRLYNETPAKYMKIMEMVDSGDEFTASDIFFA